MKDGGVIVEHGGADFLLHGDALQKGVRKHLRRAQKKFSELLLVFFIGPDRKQRSLVGEVLTAHIRKVKVCAGDIYRQICNFYTKIAQFFLPQRAGVNVILADGVALVLRIVNRDALSLNRAAVDGPSGCGSGLGVGLKIFSKASLWTLRLS